MIIFAFSVIFGYEMFFFLEDSFIYIKPDIGGKPKNKHSVCFWQLMFCQCTWHPVPMKPAST